MKFGSSVPKIGPCVSSYRAMGRSGETARCDENIGGVSGAPETLGGTRPGGDGGGVGRSRVTEGSWRGNKIKASRWECSQGCQTEGGGEWAAFTVDGPAERKMPTESQLYG
ncbi:unnamed protein product, partial [Iphiclides podalirius]